MCSSRRCRPLCPRFSSLLLLLLGGLLPACGSDEFSVAPTESAHAGGGGNSAGSGGSSGQGGMETACVPGETIPCYEGPEGTEGKGVCLGGARVCDDAGSGFGNCLGDVLPTVERCDTPEDEDCDGVENQPEAGCVCVPGAIEACYDGPSGTEGVGICAAGQRTCDEGGLGHGACENAVLPGVEDCSNQEDDDCDGSACSVTRWAKLFGGLDLDSAAAVAMDDSGIVLVGSTQGAVDFGGNTVISAGKADVLVVKLDGDGNPVWAQTFGDANTQTATSVALDANGRIVIGGTYSGKLTFGATTLVAGGTTSAFVAVLEADGTPAWASSLGTSGTADTSALAVGPDGGIVAAGGFDGTLFCTGQVPLCTSGLLDAWVRAFKPDGTVRFTKALGSGGIEAAKAVAVDGSGNIFVGGIVSSSVDVGGGNVVTAPGILTPVGWLAKLDEMGNGAWARLVPSSGQSTISSLATDAQGNVLAAGSFAGTLPLAELGSLTAQGSSDALTLKATAAGAILWARADGAPGGTTAATSIAPSPIGGTGVVLTSTQAVDVGQGPVGGFGMKDVLVVALDDAGSSVWSRGFGDPSDQSGRGVAFAPDGDRVVVGDAAGSVDFGTGALVCAGSQDFFVARIAH